MDWKLMDDQANDQNRNAGNGGDLVKHTVYLATLDFLLKREPWSQGIRLRECHAGRGICHVTADHKSRALLSCLHSIRTPSEATLLESAQRSIIEGLGCWPGAAQNVEWYAGSALIDARRLADHPASHTLDLYELSAETRQILRSVLMDMQLPTRLFWNVLSDGDERKNSTGRDTSSEKSANGERGI
jgi:23S rRNA A2030 N6-methylase RlmJ